MRETDRHTVKYKETWREKGRGERDRDDERLAEIEMETDGQR